MEIEEGPVSRGPPGYPCGVRPAVLLSVLALAVVISAPAAAATRPSERACLVAWNARSKGANRSVVAAGRPWVSASLRAGTTVTVRWTRGMPPSQTSAEACLLMLAKGGRVRMTTGIWRNGRVVRWRTQEHATDSAPRHSNVRVLPDGRVTKIYLR